MEDKDKRISRVEPEKSRLFIGVDGGGSGCRARIADSHGKLLGRGEAGPAALRLGIDRSMAAVESASRAAAADAGFPAGELRHMDAVVGLAGVGRKGLVEELVARPHPFRSVRYVNDATIACLGAHGGRDGGVVIVGTGSVGLAIVNGREVRIGGYGFPVSDGGSGAALGLGAVRVALKAYDGRSSKTPLGSAMMRRFQDDPLEVIAWTDIATATDYARFAPLVLDFAEQGDAAALEIVRVAAREIDALANRLFQCGAPRVALLGGLARRIQAFLPPDLLKRLVPSIGDAIDGALLLARGMPHEGAAKVRTKTTPDATPEAFSAPSTERVDARYKDLDSWTPADMIAAMFEGQLLAVEAVGAALASIAAAVDAAVPRLLDGGRILYVGAGTSGRIAVQDGAELTPTFDWPPERLVFLLAGGLTALTKSAEGAEDRADEGARAIEDAKLTSNDVVIAVAASGTTPYTLGALCAANTVGAVTIAVANNPHAPLLKNARYPILVETGAEIIAGSTRMKAGTAQKVVLNLLSTALMTRMGRVYRGLMVHLRVRNAKLEQRGKGIIAQIVGCSDDEAARLLGNAGGDVKSAILLGFGLTVDKAAEVLKRHQGNLRAVLNEIGHRDE